uniref:interactor of HORMAD1 protein 1 isoform X2 n=1 Tax=Monopterus albus TaxID=43700 RepID=UPI0009B48D16|nr:interactor of HORMAD1 protein 1 isoform X2 [Monopterus albus]
MQPGFALVGHVAGYLKTRAHTSSFNCPIFATVSCDLNVATSSYSGFTDSQLFFGSQFWLENSQGMSQDMSVSSRNSQHSSQEASDPKFVSSYHTKPLLFGNLKDKARAFGILDKFEEDRKKAKEKTDSDLLAKEYQHIRNSLNDIQQLLAGSEKNMIVCQTVAEKFDIFASTLQNNLNSLQSDMSQQFETLLSKINSQKEVLTELEKRVQKSGDGTAELGSNLQSLKNSLREEQERERNLLQEAIKMLSTLVSVPSIKPSPERVMDSAIQTSPELEQSLSNIVPDNKLKDAQSVSPSYSLVHVQGEAHPQASRRIVGKRKFTQRGHRRGKNRPLVPSQKRRHTVSDENCQPCMNCDKKQKVSKPIHEHKVVSCGSLNPDCVIPLKRETRSNETAGCVITPHGCWSQDSNSSDCLEEIKPISAESKMKTPVKPGGLWQLFDIKCNSDLGLLEDE